MIVVMIVDLEKQLMRDGFIKDGETKEQIIEKLISYFKMDKEKAKEYFDKHVI